jgi:hypothetical protein
MVLTTWQVRNGSGAAGTVNCDTRQFLLPPRGVEMAIEGPLI